MRLIDLHADTIYTMHKRNVDSLLVNDLHIDIMKLKKINSMIQCFAIYNEKMSDGYSFNQMMELYNFYLNTININSNDLSIINMFSDIQRNENEGKISVLMSIEDAGPLNGNVNMISKVYDMGVRMMSFTWNHENDFGYPNSNEKELNEKGLKPAGIDAIGIMNDLGIVIDISHLSDGGVSDVLRFSKKPVIASHSNSRYVTHVSRNLTDQQIKVISENGGVVGLNLCHVFLGDDRKSSIENMKSHINHIIEVGGIECIAIGTDFDGIGSDTLEIKNISEMNKLRYALKKEGFVNEDLEKIFYKNALRVFKEVLK